MRYVADLVGVQHVALGSDFDGTVTTPFDTSDLVMLTHTLLTEVNFTEAEVRLIMGENTKQFLLKNLPAE